MARGGRRIGAGRRKGSRNKATADVRALALKFVPQAMDALVAVATSRKEAGAARVAAAREIIDRGCGKVPVAVGGTDDLPPIRHQHFDYTLLSESALEEMMKIVDGEASRSVQ